MTQVKATAREITKKAEEDKPVESSSSDESSDDELIGPPLPPVLPVAVEERTKNSDSDSDSDEDISANKHFIPMRADTSMKHGNKAVTALTVDPSGARLASGDHKLISYSQTFFVLFSQTSNRK